jgi:hypothetical protein
MHKVLSIVLLCLVAQVFAQKQTTFKNAIGWDKGISYRRYIANDFWAGVNVSGTYSRASSNDSTFDSSKTSDTTFYTYKMSNKDSSTDYSGTIKLELGKELFAFKKVSVDAFVALGYTYGKNYLARSQSQLYKNERTNNSFLGVIAVEPKIFIWDRISIGTQFGMQFTYTNSTYTYYNYSDYNPPSIRINSESSTSHEQNVKLYGNISLSSLLIVHYYF